VDPSHYISRFAALLEFGEETNKVATDAIRLVSRFDRDWMARGRRPAGICGAALLLAARMNNFRRSMEEIVQVVKIADTTLKKRIDEFRKTPSGQLTLSDFRRVWLDEEMDPPAFTKGREKEEAEKRAAEDNGGEAGRKTKRKDKTAQKRKRKRKRQDSDEEAEEVEEVEEIESSPHETPSFFDPALLHQGILEGTMESIPTGMNHMPLFAPDPDEEVNNHIDPALLQQSVQYRIDAQQYTVGLPSENLHASLNINMTLEDEPHDSQQAPDYVDATMESVIVEEVSKYLGEGKAAQVSAVLDEREEEERQRRMEREEERRRRASAWREQQQYSLTSGERTIETALNVSTSGMSQLEPEEEDWTLGLDDEELDRFLLDEEEAKIKERVWVELNKDYLEALAGEYLILVRLN
jgi:transcription factor IIIB subunit 2